MKINLANIKPSPNPIRKTWDEAKMDELRWSLIEEGQVEPIGVHGNGTGYTIVWGHRRVEAARRAGWNDLEAIVVPEDEVDNLIQAGIENLSSEEMTADEKADWAYRLTQLGLSQREIARRSSIPQQTINSWMIYKQEKDAGVTINGQNGRSIDDGVYKTAILKHTLGDDIEAKIAVAEKVSDDNLTQAQTQVVAKAYRDAPTPEVKKKVLETDIHPNDTSDEIIERAIDSIELEKKVLEELGHFSWPKHPVVVNGQQGLDYLQAMVATLLKAERDVGVAAYYLRMARKAMVKMVENIDLVLGVE